MSIKTVTTILTDTDRAQDQIEAAAGAARALDAHLQVLALATGFDQPTAVQAALDAVPAGIAVEDSVTRARALAELADRVLSREDIRWNVDALPVGSTGGDRDIIRHTRYSDLLIQPRAEGRAHADRTRALAETVLFDADVPLLLLPTDAPMQAAPERILVSWDESATALRAARAALPLLSRAARVHVVLVDPPKDAPDRSDPGGAFGQFLSRHGIRCELSVCNRTDGSIAGTLEQRAADLDCDLLVMGAYGHSRLRQAIFGGTTRHFLTSGAVPVLMAH